MTENPAPKAQATAEAEVVDICRDLIRIDTTNPGDHSGPGERVAAEHVAGLLADLRAYVRPDGELVGEGPVDCRHAVPPYIREPGVVSS